MTRIDEVLRFAKLSIYSWIFVLTAVPASRKQNGDLYFGGWFGKLSLEISLLKIFHWNYFEEKSILETLFPAKFRLGKWKRTEIKFEI